MSDDFYKDKTWELLQNDIKDIKTTLNEVQQDVQSMKNQRSYLMGLVAAISIFCTIAWQWVTAKIQSGKY